MAGPVNLDELFQFSDTDPLDKTIEKVERLNSALDLLVAQAQKNAQKYADSIGVITHSVDQLEKSIESLDVTNKKDQDILAKSATSLDRLASENDQYKQSLKVVEGEIMTLIDSQKKLEEAKKRLTDLNEQEAGSLASLKKELKDAVKDYEALGTSSDNAIKQDALNRIKSLSKAVNDGDQAVKDAKKGLDIAKGSYNDLSRRVAEARKSLKDFEGGVGSTSKEFKNLQKFVKDGSDQLKEFDEKIGNSTGNVGNYQSAFEGLDNRLGGVINRFKLMGKEFLALAMNPVTAILAAIAGAFLVLNNAAETYYGSTLEGEMQLQEQMLKTEVFFKAYEGSWTNFGKHVAGVWELFKEGWRQVIRDLSPDDINKRAEEAEARAEQLAERINKNRLDHIKDVVDDADTEVQVNELLEKSKKKLLFSDKERLDFLHDANKLLEEQVKGDIQLAEDDVRIQRERIKALGGVLQEGKLLSKYTETELVNIGVKGEELDKLAAKEVDLLKVESDAANRRRALSKQEIALVEEINKARRDAARREFDSRLELNKFILSEEIKLRDQILTNENSSITDRITALQEGASKRIVLLNLEKQAELTAIKRAAEDRIRAEGVEPTAAILAQDKALQTQRELINEKYKALVIDTNKELQTKLEKNIFTSLQADYDELVRKMQTNSAEGLTELNNLFAAGGLSIEEFEKQRKDIQDKSQADLLTSRLQYLKDDVALLKAYGHDTTKIEQEIANVELAISNKSAEDRLEAEKRIQAAIVNLKQVAYDGVLQILANIHEANTISRDREISALESQKEKELKLAGDNAEAKEAIEIKYAKRVGAIQEEQARANRKRAIFEKALSLTMAAVNVAQGVTAALKSGPPPYNIILAAITAAAGAVQIATIASKPIPEFAIGTMYSPEGLAVINEQGPELIVSPRGEARMYDTPGAHLTYLEKGSKVYRADSPETKRVVEDNELNNNTRFIGDGASLMREYFIERDTLARNMDANFRKLITSTNNGSNKVAEAIRNKPERDYFNESGIAYEVQKDRHGNRTTVRKKAQGY